MEHTRWGGMRLLQLVIVGVVFAAVGIAYVTVKNDQARLETQKRQLETEIDELGKEMRLSRSRISLILKEDKLEERLKRANSGLRPISVGEILNLQVEADIPGQSSVINASPKLNPTTKQRGGQL